MSNKVCVCGGGHAKHYDKQSYDFNNQACILQNAHDERSMLVHTLPESEA